jgi:hypothetical protein
MRKKEKRKFQRVEIYSPILYLCIDKNGNILEQNMGIARNVSQAGIQIQTFQKIDSEYVILICTNLDRFQIEAKGKVIYCRRINSDLFSIGIKLQETAEKNICLIKALVRSFYYGKAKTHLKITPEVQN